MANKISYRTQGQGLFQSSDAQQAMIAKMRTRLAGGSEMDVVIQNHKKQRAQKNLFGWFFKGGIVAIVILINMVYLEQKGNAPLMESVKRVPKLEMPKQNLSLDERALFWTYALYDYQSLQTQFKIKQNVVINAHQAQVELENLLPKISSNTRIKIQQYLKTTPKRA